LPGVLVAEGLLDAAGGGGSDALVDRQGLPQAGGALAVVAVLEVAAADAFQGACFVRGVPRSRAMTSAWACWSRACPSATCSASSAPANRTEAVTHARQLGLIP
jgi:hypothetical protein